MSSAKPLVPGAEPLREVARARARAEFVEQKAMLEHVRAEYAVIDASDDTTLGKQVAKTGVVLAVAQALGLSEGQAVARIAVLGRTRDRLPLVWVAFSRGDVDSVRVREISHAAGRLVQAESVIALDRKAAVYAPGHTVAELRGWLRRFVRRAEPDLTTERAAAERADRRVAVEHGDQGMSWLTAYLPSDVAAAIDYRLNKTARAMDGDSRTSDQRRADLLATWATAGQVDADSIPRVRVDIALTIAADVLAGATAGWGTSADGSWAIPAAWVADLAASGNPFWHRMVLDPVTADVLTHDYAGRFAPEILTKAIAFRDGVCQAPGCLTPAHDCDLDHRQPWPAGRTTGTNLWPLCTRNHRMKGHGILAWVLPDGHTVPSERADHQTGPPDCSWTEHHLAILIAVAA